ncbi:MAG TPA: carboxypeptidase-like regulatory domain-containing protein, partial [Pyrinomonadaceae bacterium]|nr:carboxypeptidase-like regulatory domain-containing protein [Pyrinomonadaceae bacterium]
LLFIFISSVWLPFIAAEVRACTCNEYDVPVCAAYWRSDAVFAGHLLDITPREKASRDRLPTVMLHFIVEQSFRGVAGNRVEVETLHGTSCDMNFEKGERYLVYASRARDGQLFAGPCSRTNNLKYADDDLSFLRALAHQGAKESILGRLVHNKYNPLPGNKVTVQSHNKILETKTDEKGNFSVLLPGPGNYKVRAFIPFAAIVMAYHEDEQGKLETTDALTTFEYEVQVARNQCNYRQIDAFKIDLHATAEISGSVLTSSGRPVRPGHVYLVSAADPNASTFEKLKDNGSFKFEGVAVGEYYLVLNPRNEAPDDDDPPYPRTYYPHAADASAATRIVVTEGVKLENLILRVGPSWKGRVVTGKVIWQDGRPARSAHVSLYADDRYVRLIKLDEKGRFNFKVYGDFKYAILAETWSPERGKSERLSFAEKSTGLTLVLQRID